MSLSSATTLDAILHGTVVDSALLLVLSPRRRQLPPETGVMGENELIQQVLIEVDQRGGGLTSARHDDILLDQAVEDLRRVDLELSKRHEHHGLGSCSLIRLQSWARSVNRRRPPPRALSARSPPGPGRSPRRRPGSSRER